MRPANGKSISPSTLLKPQSPSKRHASGRDYAHLEVALSQIGFLSWINPMCDSSFFGTHNST